VNSPSQAGSWKPRKLLTVTKGIGTFGSGCWSVVQVPELISMCLIMSEGRIKGIKETQEHLASFMQFVDMLYHLNRDRFFHKDAFTLNFCLTPARESRYR